MKRKHGNGESNGNHPVLWLDNYASNCYPDILQNFFDHELFPGKTSFQSSAHTALIFSRRWYF